MKPKLLIIELWGLGDLAIATPFLRAASDQYTVTLLAKPYAQDLQARLWPGVEVLPFVAPWTAFQGKYHLWRWPWLELLRLRRLVAERRFDAGLSARWDPRDHVLLRGAGIRRRYGFPRLQSQVLLTDPLVKPVPRDHRYEYWRVLAQALDLTLPPRDVIPMPLSRPNGTVFLHSGAGQPVRVWPLGRYRLIVQWLREKKYRVVVACDPDQRDWWLRAGETGVFTPRTVNDLVSLIDEAGVFIGNDSGPGHLAAFCGVPTFSFFGPQLPEWFAPLHPDSLCLEGKPCPYKPCSDYCRFSLPRCLSEMSEAEAWFHLEPFVAQHLGPRPTVPRQLTTV
ncbi:MAG: glycosyltransferase family 9 protein [Verrucomicrobia subdivision 3 bacterium]|nr:glycosyltransferase family 9 protein [Verrucomicrobiota bacterium]MCC6822876.1 glycosyltransferase family 9 protein [Limisphaerales bacterium]